MKLTAVMWDGDTRIDYEFTPKTRTHQVWIDKPDWNYPDRFSTKSSGMVINALAPHRASEDVCDMIHWLSDLCKLPRTVEDWHGKACGTE